MNLIILFNKIESHTNFNGRGKIKPCLYLNGFGGSNSFIRVLPKRSIENCVFSSSDNILNLGVVKHTEILLIQLSENIKAWNENFKNDFISYVSNFDTIYISYHRGPNDGDDIRNGNHRLIENYLEGQPVITTDKYHHDFFMGEEEQLYGVLARAIVDNKGVFTEESYNSLVDKLVSLIEPSTNDELELIHHCLTNLGTNSLSLKGEEYLKSNINQYEELIKSAEGQRKINKILHKKSMTL